MGKNERRIVLFSSDEIRRFHHTELVQQLILSVATLIHTSKKNKPLMGQQLREMRAEIKRRFEKMKKEDE